MGWLRWIGFGLLALIVLICVLLTPAHLQIRELDPDPPPFSALLALDGEADRPVRLGWMETSRQPSFSPPPRVLSHPSFALEWSDGRILLVDLGMGPEAARKFGAPFESLGAGPVEVFGSVGELLGDAADRVAGVVITHLHIDHVEGARSLCEVRGGAALPIFQVRAQAELTNYGTRSTSELVDEVGCLNRTILPAGNAVALPGFPGVALIHAAGHTPGSQMLAASLAGPDGTKRVIFTGDVINDIESARLDRPKALIYRLLIVPEADGQLSRIRRFLAGLERDHGFSLAIAHDGDHLASLGLPGVTGP